MHIRFNRLGGSGVAPIVLQEHEAWNHSFCPRKLYALPKLEQR
jgi:hypothetical protein